MALPKKLLLLTALLVAAALLPVTSANAAQPQRTDVIVTLALPAAVPGADQSAVIAQATDTLLALLPGGDYTVNDRYTVLPYLALSAGPITLSVLQHSGLVAAIELDGTVTAASSPKKCKTVKRSKHGKKGRAAKKCKASSVVH
ncbi:MAG: hypothetical protein ACRDKI_04380 [Solirubrobacterales bacterium]